MSTPAAPGRIVRTGPAGQVGAVRCHDTLTGADIVSAGREELRYELSGRSVPIFIEHGSNSTLIVYGIAGSWSDGSQLDLDQRRSLRDTLLLVADFRGWRVDLPQDLLEGQTP